MRRYVKLSMILSVVLLLSVKSQSQTFSEWFKQKKTQINYLGEQIAELQIQIGLLKKGYHLLRDGLSTIHQITHGEFDLHTAFLTALKKVNPEILTYARIGNILVMQKEISRHCRQLLHDATQCGQFTEEELAGFREVTANLIKEVTDNLDELVTITTNSRLEMKDDERIRRIGAIRERTVQHWVVLRQMDHQLMIVARQRWQEQSDIERIKKWHDVK